ncbi:hypothetical protein BDK51DRAFT_41940 [Blyttiomyces helicus]|uniref:Uncharacterized protein n=1 Tax=Blyttiomyces helicus TaxID=388810 RepID=A0A4P9W482_9FUNG|nr:hypothetical protein BDK51DRAFT_41940 [Blyttiomyces helicus]|eukprot:RKO86692.1 hypothetical protein BDK51DRAFT_41940 [Blyttiomyces helicus]
MVFLLASVGYGVWVIGSVWGMRPHLLASWWAAGSEVGTYDVGYPRLTRKHSHFSVPGGLVHRQPCRLPLMVVGYMIPLPAAHHALPTPLYRRPRKRQRLAEAREPAASREVTKAFCLEVKIGSDIVRGARLIPVIQDRAKQFNPIEAHPGLLEAVRSFRASQGEGCPPLSRDNSDEILDSCYTDIFGNYRATLTMHLEIRTLAFIKIRLRYPSDSMDDPEDDAYADMLNHLPYVQGDPHATRIFSLVRASIALFTIRSAPNRKFIAPSQFNVDRKDTAKGGQGAGEFIPPLLGLAALFAELRDAADSRVIKGRGGIKGSKYGVRNIKITTAALKKLLSETGYWSREKFTPKSAWQKVFNVSKFIDRREGSWFADHATTDGTSISFLFKRKVEVSNLDPPQIWDCTARNESHARPIFHPPDRYWIGAAPTPEELRGKWLSLVDPGVSSQVVSHVAPISQAQEDNIITQLGGANSHPMPPFRHNPPRNGSDGLLSRTAARPHLVLDTFSKSFLPSVRLTSARFKREAGIVKAARKFENLKKECGIDEIVRDYDSPIIQSIGELPEHAYTIDAALDRIRRIGPLEHVLKEFYERQCHRQAIFRAYTLRQKALSRKGS